jgi:gamma-glutamyltranspeptidase/glutathione hydrolase
MKRSLLFTTVVLIACARREEATIMASFQAPAQVARATTGMVVSGSAIASEVGARVLEQGGNAVDAAVATAFALSVVEPTMSGIGGRTQLLIRSADGKFHGIDGGTSIPAAYVPGTVPSSDTAHGYKTIGVPGTPAALALALERHGTFTLARVLRPAIALARDGFVLPAAEAERIAGEREGLTRGARAYFLRPDGTAHKAGERFVQADLARTLETIANEGVRAFYNGRMADMMVRDVRANGGSLQLSDLHGYAADEARVVHGSYRAHDLHGTYLPASGVTTIQALQILENFELAPIAGTAAWAGLLTRALLLAFDDRVADFGSEEAKAAKLVSKEHARERAAQVRASAGRASTPPDEEPEHTTHLSVADRNGGVVALTQSVGPMMGSRAATPGLGFLYAATMGYLGDVKPGDRPFSSQSPLIVTQNGELRYVLGGAGARRIIPALVAVLSRSIDQKLSFSDAMAAPRLHALPARIDLEKRAPASWTGADSAALVGLGFTVRMRSDAPYFARVHGIAFDARQRVFIGVADPRWQGASAAPRR